MAQLTPSLHLLPPAPWPPPHAWANTQQPTPTPNSDTYPNPKHYTWLPPTQPAPTQPSGAPQPLPAPSRPCPRPQAHSRSTRPCGRQERRGALGREGRWPVWGLRDQDSSWEGKVGGGTRPRRGPGRLSRCASGRAWSSRPRGGRVRRVPVTASPHQAQIIYNLAEQFCY